MDAGTRTFHANYELTERDHIAAQERQYHARRTALRKDAPFNRGVRLFVLLAVLFVLCAVCLTGLGGGTGWFGEIVRDSSGIERFVFGTLLAILVFLLLLFVAARIAMRTGRLVRRVIRKSPHLVGPRKMSASPEAIRIETEYVDTQVRWKGVRDLLEDAERFYVIVGDQNMLIVPKSAMGPDADAFRNAINTWIVAAHV